jgi:hypothetical protein
MREHTNGDKHMTPRLRRLILAVSVISIASGVVGLALGHVASGVLLAGLGSVAPSSVLYHWKNKRRGSGQIASFQLIKAYSFFGMIALGGIVVFLLAVVGAVREPVVSGTLGLAATGLATYVLVRSRFSAVGRKGRRRGRRRT